MKKTNTKNMQVFYLLKNNNISLVTIKANILHYSTCKAQRREILIFGRMKTNKRILLLKIEVEI